MKVVNSGACGVEEGLAFGELLEPLLEVSLEASDAEGVCEELGSGGVEVEVGEVDDGDDGEVDV